MPNYFSYLTLILWPAVSISIFKKLPVIPAVFITIVGGYLLLPSRVVIDIPLLPAFDKQAISFICALFGCIAIKKIKINMIPKKGVERLFILTLYLLPIFTTLTNSNAVFNGKWWISGLTLYDAFHHIIETYIGMIPFILGLQLITKYDEQLLIFKYLVIAGLLYSLPILFEIRMSPQLHNWIYGFYPSSFGQSMRDGGFRAVVFLGHGLTVAMFILISVASAIILWKKRINTHGIPAIFIVIFLMLILLLSKTLGVLIIATLLLICMVWLPNAIDIRIAKVIILLAIIYPVLSILELFPHKELVEFIASYNVDRAQSLEFRFFHESRLLEHAMENSLFGWGGWSRNRLWDSVTDGFWIITLGVSGIIGYCAVYGLMTASAWKGIKSCNYSVIKDEKNLMVYHILIVAIIMIDQIPNSSMSGYLWLIIGALAGRANTIINTSRKTYK